MSERPRPDDEAPRQLKKMTGTSEKASDGEGRICQKICLGCGKTMTEEARLIHLGLSKRCSKAESAVIIGKDKPLKPVSHRSRRTMDFKCDILSKLSSRRERHSRSPSSVSRAA